MKYHFEKEFKHYSGRATICKLVLNLQPESVEDLVIINQINYLEAEGVAVCHPNEVFNKMKGERIAESRASIRILRKLKWIIKRVKSQSEQVLDNTSDQLNKVLKIYNKEIIHHQDLVKSNNP